jgi:hypothetical protein
MTGSINGARNSTSSVHAGRDSRFHWRFRTAMSIQCWNQHRSPLAAPLGSFPLQPKSLAEVDIAQDVERKRSRK